MGGSPRPCGKPVWIVFTITGTAGSTAGTYANTASARSSNGSDRYYDPVVSSDSSTVSLQIFNTRSSFRVTKKFTGLAPGGLAAAATFTGRIQCGTQSPGAWSVTIPAGSSSATSAALSFYDGDDCTVTEDAPPAAPDGYRYAGPAAVTPAAVTDLGPEETVDVTSTTPLVPAGQLRIDKSVNRSSQAPGGQVVYTVSVTNTGGVDATGVTAVDTLPAGIEVTGVTGAGVVAGDRVTWTGLDVPAGRTRSFDVTASIADTAPAGVLVNEFTATSPAGFDPTTVEHVCDTEPGSSCAAVVVAATPNAAAMDITKRVVDLSGPDADGVSVITYELAVRNSGRDQGSYSLDDRLDFGDGLTVLDVAATNVVPGDIAVSPSFDGQDDSRIVTGRSIAGGRGLTDVYQVRVTARSSTTMTSEARDCTTAPGEQGTGYRNNARLSGALVDASDAACATVGTRDGGNGGGSGGGDTGGDDGAGSDDGSAGTSAGVDDAGGTDDGIQQMLPDTGGPAIGVLGAGLVLVVLGAMVLAQRRRRRDGGQNAL